MVKCPLAEVMSSILISSDREEEDLACYLTAFYEFNLEKKKITDKNG